MRRSLGLRIGTLVLVVFTTTAPAFAAPRDESSAGIIGRAIERIVRQVKKVIHPFDEVALPKG